MAYLVPENLPSRSDIPNAVQQVAAALRDFTGDDVTVWLDEEDEEKYLAVLDPSFGVLLIHAVQRGAEGLRQSRGRFRREAPIPLDKLVENVADVAAELRRRLQASDHLRRQVPVVVTAAVPTVSRSRASRLGFDDDSMDALLLEEDFVAGLLGPAIQRVLGITSERLDEPEERAVRAVLRPDIVIRDTQLEVEKGLVFRPPAGSTPDTVLAVLDRQQENLARYLGDGYRVIKGVAGSGKTLVLTYRVRFVAQERPDARILMTCFNKVLADQLAAELADLPSVDVRNIDAHAFRLAPGRNLGRDNTFLQQRLNAIALLERHPTKRRYDLVVVDEAQDLDEAALRLAHLSLRPQSGDFVVALDAAQNIYRRTSWTPPGTSGRGRTKILRLNYRNTKEILQLARDFLSAGLSTESADGELDDPSVVIPPEASARRGERPRVLTTANHRQTVDAICADIRRVHARGARWSEIAVLFGSRRLKEEMSMAAARSRIPYHDVKEDRAGNVTAGERVRGSTFQLLKGLEFPHVYMCGVDEVAAGPGADDETKRRLVYVGMTRATDYLTIVLDGHGTLSSDIRRAADG